MRNRRQPGVNVKALGPCLRRGAHFITVLMAAASCSSLPSETGSAVSAGLGNLEGFTAQALPMPTGFRGAEVTAVSETGAMAGFGRDPSYNEAALAWYGGDPVVLPVPTGTIWSNAWDITPTGRIVAGTVVQAPDYRPRVVTWTDGELEVLDLPPGTDFCYNPRLDGQGRVFAVCGFIGQFLAVFHYDGGWEQIDFGVSTSLALLSDVSAAGVAVGTLYWVGASYAVGFAWHQGHTVLIEGFEPKAVNARGQILGGKAAAGQQVWFNGSFNPVTGLSAPTDLNDAGVVVGWDAVWLGGEVTPLPVPTGGSSCRAATLNNRGTPAGMCYISGVPTAVVWAH